MKEKYKIVGMTCSACQAAVTRAVEKVENVQSVNVNLLTNSMEVVGDFVNEEIEKAVSNAGYQAINEKDREKREKVVDESKEMKKRFFTSLCFLIPVSILSLLNMFTGKIVFNDFWLNLFFGEKGAFNLAFVEMLLVLPIIVINKSYFIRGFKSLFKGNPNMDTLISVGASASYIYGIIVIFKIVNAYKNANFVEANSLSMLLYFESAGMVLTLITLGKMLESKSKKVATDEISKLVLLSPKYATIEVDGKTQSVLSENIKVGDIVVIKSGEGIGVDGEIIFGSGAFSEANITGESLFVEKGVGDKVISGTSLSSGFVKIRAEKVGEDSTIAEIIRYVEEASNSKAPVQKLADKIAGVFVPIVMLISLITFIIWLIARYSFDFSLNLAISVLVISCPCALGLATPVAIMVASSEGAKRGILIKNGEALELLAKVDAVVLDKTGTITMGEPAVTDFISIGYDQKLLEEYVYSLEKNSAHPISSAIVAYGENKKLNLHKVEKYNSVVGSGIEGVIDGKKIKIGNEKFCEFIDDGIIDRLSQKGKTGIIVSIDERVAGIIGVKDQVKKSSKEMVEVLHKKGIQTYMLTGDSQNTAKAIAKEVGINEVFANVLPVDKGKVVEKIQKEGKIVAFVGDGVNDAVALKQANVGLAISEGAEIAVDYADGVIKGKDMTNLSNTIMLSKKAMRIIKGNLFWAFFYNIICIPVAAGVLYLPLEITLNPMIGAVAMCFSSIFVVLNSLRIKSKERIKGENIMTKKVIIEGMMCNHCVMHVQKALDSLGVNSKVDLATNSAEIFGQFDQEKVIQAIENEGYKVVEIK